MPSKKARSRSHGGLLLLRLGRAYIIYISPGISGRDTRDVFSAAPRARFQTFSSGEEDARGDKSRDDEDGLA